MEQLHVKKVIQHKLGDNSTNRLRFSGVKERELATSADVYRRTKGDKLRVHQSKSEAKTADDDAKDGSSKFQKELDLIHEKNASEEFTTFYRECWPLCRSFPELLHYKGKILELLLKLLSCARLAGTKIDQLYLLGVLARDLREELTLKGGVHPILRKVLSIVDPLSPSVTEGVFQCVSYIFLYTCSNSECASDEMTEYYGGALGHRKEFVRKLSAEAFSSLFRKCKKRKLRRNHVRGVLRAFAVAASNASGTSTNQRKLDAENTVNGMAQFLFYTLKGIPGQLHSKGGELIKIVLDCLTDGKLLAKATAGDEGRESSALHVVESVVITLLRLICQHVHIKHFGVVWDELFASLDETRKTAVSAGKSQQQSLKRMARVVIECVKARESASIECLEEESMRFATVLESLLVESCFNVLPTTVQEAVVRLMCATFNVYVHFPHFTSRLSKFFSSVVLASESSSTSSISMLARGLLPILPRHAAMQSLAPALLSAAARNTQLSKHTSLFLLHTVASVQPKDKSYADDDAMFYIENARECAVEEMDRKALLVMSCAHSDNSGLPDISFIAKCLPFLVITSPKSSRNSDEKEVCNWLISNIDEVETKLKLQSRRAVTDENKESNDLFVTIAILLDSLSAICFDSVTNRHAEKGSSAKKFLEKAKLYAEALLFAHPNSLWAMKGVASFVKALQSASLHLTGDFEKVFDAIIPNLRCPNHFIRLHTLTILESFPIKPFVVDHAELDLTDDLDEEYSTRAVNDSTGPVEMSVQGSCHLMEILLALESIPVAFRNQRQFVSELNRVEVLARTGKIPVVYAEAAASLMFGMFHVKFSTIWPAARQALISLVEHYEECVWSPLHFKLEEVMKIEEFNEVTSLDFINDFGAYLQDQHTMSIAWDSSMGKDTSIFNNKSTTALNEGRVSWHQNTDTSTLFKLTWGVMEAVPQLALKKSQVIVPMFLAFLHEQFYVAYDDDPDAREFNLSDHISGKSNFYSTAAATIGRGIAQKKLTCFLKMFSAVTGPKQLYKHQLLQIIFTALLSNSEQSVAQVAFNCLCKYKIPYLVPYNNQLRQILTKGELRDALAKFDVSKDGKVIDQQHRDQFIPILTRILFGRFTARNTGRKSAKDSPDARRAAILSFLSGLNSERNEYGSFVYLMIRPFIPPGASTKIDCSRVGDCMYERKRISLLLDATKTISVQSISHVLPQRRMGYLNLLSSVISHFGHSCRIYLPVFIPITLAMVEFSELDRKSSSQSSETAHTILEGVNKEDEKKSGARDPSSRFSSRQVRSVAFSALSGVFSRFPSINYSQYTDRMWTAFLPSLFKLPDMVINAENPPMLLRMIEVLSSHPRLVSLLVDDAVVAVIKCISSSSRSCVIEICLTFIDNLLTEGKSMDSPADGDGTEVGVKLIEANLDLIISQFAQRLESPGSIDVRGSHRPPGSDAVTKKKELAVLCRVSELLVVSSDGIQGVRGLIDEKKASMLYSLCKLLLTFTKPGGKSHDDVKMNVLKIIQSFIPMMKSEDILLMHSDLSKLLGPDKSKAGMINAQLRQELVQIFFIIADKIDDCPSFKDVATALKDLNAWNTKRLDEHDFDAMLPVLTGLASNEDNSYHWLHFANEDANNLVPIIYHCFHSLYDSDGVVSRGSFKALETFVSIACNKAKNGQTDMTCTWLKVLQTVFVRCIRSGISTTNDSVRRSFVLLLAKLSRVASNLESLHLYGDLCLLARDDDIEQDFFINITHVQTHRRGKALVRLRKYLSTDLQTCPFNQPSLGNILLPLVIHPVYECTKSSEETLALEAVATIGAISRNLNWSKYQSTLWNFLIQIPRHAGQERYLIGAICAMLDAFHFDMESSSRQSDKEEADRLDEDNAVRKTICRRIIPKVEQYLIKEGTDKTGSRLKLIRPPIALALLKLFQKLPENEFNQKLPNLLLTVCGVLQSKDSSAREDARKTMSRMAVTLGVNFLPSILRELTISLSHGYQLHVRSATLLSILIALSDHYVRPDDISAEDAQNLSFDKCVPAMMELIQEDIFGVASEMKAAESTKKRVIIEAMGVKSYESLEIMSRLILFRPSLAASKAAPLSSVHAIVQPLLERLRLPDVDKATIGKVRECLNKVVVGISRNTSAIAVEIMPFVYTTITSLLDASLNCDDPMSDSDDDDSEKDISMQISGGKRSLINSSMPVKKKLKGTVSSWMPSEKGNVSDARGALDLKKKQTQELRQVRDGASAPKLTGNSRHGPAATSAKKNFNDPSQLSIVVFVLSLFHSSLKRSKLDWNDSDVKSMADPFVPFLTKCVKDCSDKEAILLCLRCLNFLLRWDLPSVPGSAKVLCSNVLNILTSVGTDARNEMTQGCFKILSFLLHLDKKAGAVKILSDDDVEAINGTSDIAGDGGGMPLKKAQMRALISLLHGAITDVMPHNSTLALIKTIASRKYLSAEFYDMMEIILKLNVQSQHENVRQTCGQIFLQFYIDYPLGKKRLEQHMGQMIQNVKYVYEAGRISAIELVTIIVQKLPLPLLEEYAHLIFFPFVLQLVNDDSKKCKEAIATGITSLLKRISIERLQSFYEYIARWFSGGDACAQEPLQRTAAQLYGIIVDSRIDFVKKSDTASDLVKNLYLVMKEEVKQESYTCLENGRWELLYFCLICFEKLNISDIAPSLSDHDVWELVVSALVHPHPWVQQAASRTINAFVISLDPKKIGCAGGNRSLFIATHKGTLYDVARNLCFQMNAAEEEQNNNLLMLAIKTLSWVVQAMHNFPKLCFKDDAVTSEKPSGSSDNEEVLPSKDPVLWLFKRLSNIAKNRGQQRRNGVFKCYAAFATVCERNLLSVYLSTMIEPLHRVLTEAENEENSKNQNLASEEITALPAEVMQLLEERCGTETFIKAYAEVKTQAQEKRVKRKSDINAETVADPRAAATRKIKKQEGNKRRRKRRMEEKKAARGSFQKRKNKINID